MMIGQRVAEQLDGKMHKRLGQRGVALMMCIFALMLLSAVGVGLMYAVNSETTINANYRDSQVAYFASVAGLQEVRARLSSPVPASTPAISVLAAPQILPTTTDPSTVLYVRNPNDTDTIEPWNMDASNRYRDDELCHEQFAGLALTGDAAASQPNVRCTTAPAGSCSSGTGMTCVNSVEPYIGTARALAYKWVRVTLKNNRSASPYYVDGSGTGGNSTPICWDGTKQLPKPLGYVKCDDNPPPGSGAYMTPVYRLSALAVAPGGSRRMTQMEVANTPPFITNASLDTNNFVNASGSSVTINGYDNCKCRCTLAVGAAAPTCTNRATGGACTGDTYAIYTSQQVTTSGSPVLIAGTNPAVAQNQSFPYDIARLINQYRNAPGTVNATGAPYNYNCSPSTTAPYYRNCGTVANATYGTLPNPFPPVNPNTPVGAVNQVTYVPGSIDVTAQSTGSGVLIVDGDLTIHGGLQFYGIVIVRGVLTFSGSGNGQNINVLGSMLAGQGSLADTLGGGVNIQYDRCALLNSQPKQAPALLSFNETSY